MKVNKYFSCFFVITFILYLGGPWPPRLEKKVLKTVEKTFSPNCDLQPVSIDDKVDIMLSTQMNGHLYKVLNDDILKGYIYVNEANSMKNVFDYIILFSDNFEIINLKVLIYREEHGRQIGTKRWLSQFFGLGSEDKPELGVNVDGITGATISATSMTEAVHDVLESIHILKSEGRIE